MLAAVEVASTITVNVKYGFRIVVLRGISAAKRPFYMGPASGILTAGEAILAIWR